MLDTCTWKEYGLASLFDFQLPQGDLQVKKVRDGNIPLITPSAFNNGLLKRIASDSQSTLFLANTLTVDMFGNAYYQEEPYFVTAHGHVNVLLPKIELNKYSGMYIATAIRSMFLNKYGFSEMCTKTVLTKEKVCLPALQNGQPDCAYMESYMKQVLKKARQSLALLLRANDSKHTITVNEWGDFRVGDLFVIHPTKAYKMTNNDLMKENGTNTVIVNSGFNNGVGGFTDYACTEKAGIITFTDTAAKSAESFFYQAQDFVGYPHVQGMYMQDHVLTENEGKFIATVLRSTVGKYDFILKMTRDEVVNLIIKLPITTEGTPNWEYMNAYMSEINANASNCISLLGRSIN